MELDLEEGTVLAGKFRIVRELGAGGMGRIYLAEHLELGIRVALKVPHPKFLETPDAYERFRREARAAAALTNAHVCRIFDVGRTDDGISYIVMEYLRGTSLQQRLKEQGRLPANEVADYVVQTCEGLAEAHSLGIVHRDLKPGNLILATGADQIPRVKVLDFGISLTEHHERITRQDVVLGSPQFMSPEQFAAPSNVDARSDIWSLGVTIHYLATGHFPFTRTALAAFMEEPGALAIHASVPEPLRPIVERCLRSRIDERYADVGELATALVELVPDARDRAARIQRMLRANAAAGDTIDAPKPPSQTPTRAERPAARVEDSAHIVTSPREPVTAQGHRRQGAVDPSTIELSAHDLEPATHAGVPSPRPGRHARLMESPHPSDLVTLSPIANTNRSRWWLLAAVGSVLVAGVVAFAIAISTRGSSSQEPLAPTTAVDPVSPSPPKPAEPAATAVAEPVEADGAPTHADAPGSAAKARPPKATVPRKAQPKRAQPTIDEYSTRN